MKRYSFYPFLLLWIGLFYIGYNFKIGSEIVRTPDSYPILSFKNIDSKHSHNNKYGLSKRPSELVAMKHCLSSSKSFLSASDNLNHFLDQVKKRNAQNQIKNGNLREARAALDQYDLLLKSFCQLQDSLGVTSTINRTAFYSKHKENGKLDWKTYQKKRIKLKRNFKYCKKHLRLVLSTEMSIWEQKEHFPTLAEKMNKLYNLDGSLLPIYVFSYPKLFYNQREKVVGLAIIIKYKGFFTSLSPKLKKQFPKLHGKNKALAIHLESDAGGQILSHEFGHLFYLYNHWQEYQSYISSQKDGYKLGGHGLNDPSGKAATRAENGLMPY